MRVDGKDGDYYYGYDHFYSPSVLFNAAALVVERYEYDAYGALKIKSKGLFMGCEVGYIIEGTWLRGMAKRSLTMAGEISLSTRR